MINLEFRLTDDEGKYIVGEMTAEDVYELLDDIEDLLVSNLDHRGYFVSNVNYKRGNSD